MTSFANSTPLNTDAEYEAAIAEIDALLEAAPAAGGEAYYRFAFLSVLVEANEAEHHPDRTNISLRQNGIKRS